MKKILIRLVGTVCILASVLTMFFTTWIQIDGVRTKVFRETRESIYSDLDHLTSQLSLSIDAGSIKIKEDLKDNDLPHTKSGIKKRITKIRGILGDLIDDKLGLGEILTISLNAPQYIVDTTNMLYTDYVRYKVSGVATTISLDGLEDFTGALTEYSWCFTAVSILFFSVILLGLAAAVFNLIDKANALKYIYFGVLILLVAGLAVALPHISEIIASTIMLPEDWEDISFKLTVMPFLTAILALAPCVISTQLHVKNKRRNN